jgi:hypothetical protein
MRSQKELAVTARPLPSVVQVALEDFPLQDLLSAFRSERDDDGEHHHNAFLDSCLANWIEGLEADMHRYPVNIDEAHQRMHERQSVSREALIRLRQALNSAASNA